MLSDTSSKKKAAMITTMMALLLSAIFCWAPLVGGGAAPTPAGPAAVQTQAAASPENDPAQKLTVAANYGRLPLYFIENRGQVDKRVQYYVRGGGQTTFFTKDEVVLALCRQEKNPPLPPVKKGGKGGAAALKGGVPAANPEGANVGAVRRPIKGPTQAERLADPAWHRQPASLVRIKPMGLKKGARLAALQKTDHRVNYFIGNNPKIWRTDIPTYRAVVYENAYAGIDLKFYGQGRQLEYDIVVQPGADPNQVRFAYQGVQKLEVTPEGDLALILPDGGKLLQKKPVVYQDIAGQRVPVDSKFRLCGRGAQVTCGFTVAAYDTRRPLVIDPVLDYSTYLGGTDDDGGIHIAVDNVGAAYVTGRTKSTNFSTQQAFQGTNAGDYDAFITKLSPAGNALVYSTYLGGSDYDDCYGIAVDADGAAYVTGSTNSANFPTQQAFQGTKGGNYDVFVTKLSPAGNALVYSTYLGGTWDNLGYGIAVDNVGAAYVTGNTNSPDFPTQQAYQTANAGSSDAFVTKLSPAGNTLVYSTYLGGSSSDYGWSIAVDATGAAYVAGQTDSTNFPTEQAFQGTKAGNYDAFATKLSPAGNALDYSTYLGGSDDDGGGGIAVDAAGAAYVTGYTLSANFPTEQAFQGTYGGGYDVFVTKLSAAGNALVYSTYLGGTYEDAGIGIAVDNFGAAYVTGYTLSANFPTQQAYHTAIAGYNDAFVTKLSPAGNALVYSTYLGGTDDDFGFGIAVDKNGAAYFTGMTKSANFPTQQAFQGTYGGGGIYDGDAFVTKLIEGIPPPYSPLVSLLEYSRALDNHPLTFVSGGSASWFSQTEVSHFGGSAARSGAIGHSQSSWLQSTITGPGELSFFWKVSSEEDYDTLKLLIDGSVITAISGEQDWHQVVVVLPPGSVTVQWQYGKDGTAIAGQDCGWLDQVSFTPTGLSLNKALDNPWQQFRTGAPSIAGRWYGESGSSVGGGSAARSGVIGHSQSTWLETTLTGPGVLSFSWKVSCELVADYLEVTLDGAQQTKITGEKDWAGKTLNIPAGSHTLRWTYRKDGSGSAGADGGWLDRVAFTTTSVADLNNALDTLSLVFSSGGDTPWAGQTLASAHGGSAAASGALDNTQHAWLKTVVRGPGKVSFDWKVSCETPNGPSYDFLECYLDGVALERLSGEVDWSSKAVVIPPGEHALVWIYAKNGSFAAGDDKGYVDRIVYRRSAGSAPSLLLLLQ